MVQVPLPTLIRLILALTGTVLGVILGIALHPLRSTYDAVVRFADMLAAMRNELEEKLRQENALYHRALLIGKVSAVWHELARFYEDVSALYPYDVDDRLRKFYAAAETLIKMLREYPNASEIRSKIWRVVWGCVTVLVLDVLSVILVVVFAPLFLYVLVAVILVGTIVCLYTVLARVHGYLEELDGKRREFCGALDLRISLVNDLPELRGKAGISEDFKKRLCG